MPLFRSVLGEYKRLVRAEHVQRVRIEQGYAGLVLDVLADLFPDLRIPGGLGNGGAEDMLGWRGHKVSAAWVPYLCQVFDIYRAVPPGDVASLMEIGPGLGFSTLAHWALNPGLRIVLNIDIPPILYVSTQFLKSIPDIQVVDYRATRDMDPIEPQPSLLPCVYQLAPWQLPKLRTRFHAFVNAFSFQEMEPDICRNYARFINTIVDHHVILFSWASRPKAVGKQEKAIPTDFLLDLFCEAFPVKRDLQVRMRHHYESKGAAAFWLSKSESTTKG
jgi:hypothetical protein